MGQESLEKISVDRYLSYWQKELNEEIDKQYLKDHFMIGCGGDKNKIKFYQLYLKTFCTDNCELSNWIWKKINGYFEEVKIDCDGKVTQLKYESPEKIIKVYNNYTLWKKTEW